jgi:hypothetical protein
MTLIARPATEGRWLDTATKLTLASAKGVFGFSSDPAQCIKGVIRYVPLPGNNPAQDIDRDELEMLCGLGLEVMLVQHVRSSAPGRGGWDIRAHSGSVDGAFAAEHAVNCGYPDAHLWQDLEDVSGDAAATIQYSNAWAGRALQWGLRAGVYVGFDIPLTPEQLYRELEHNSYGSDVGHRHVSERGISWQQTRENIVIAGVKVDEGQIQRDLLCEAPFACVAA